MNAVTFAHVQVLKIPGIAPGGSQENAGTKSAFAAFPRDAVSHGAIDMHER